MEAMKSRSVIRMTVLAALGVLVQARVHQSMSLSLAQINDEKDDGIGTASADDMLAFS